MKKRDRIVIFALVGVMLFSVFATGLLLVFSGSSGDDLASLDEQIEQIENNPTEENQVVCAASSDALSNSGNPVGPWPYKTEEVTELVVEDLREGDGQAVELNDCITVHYRLATIDGTPVAGNDTFQDGQPIAFELVEGGLIDGWIQGIPGMKVGGVRRLTVPASLAYGDSERPGIPAGSTLVFEVEIVEIVES